MSRGYRWQEEDRVNGVGVCLTRKLNIFSCQSHDTDSKGQNLKEDSVMKDVGSSNASDSCRLFITLLKEHDEFKVYHQF